MNPQIFETDRIAELRALLARLQTDENPYAQFEALLVAERNLPALLDCAEALRRVTQALEWHAHGRCRGIDDGPLLGTADAVALGVAALARLNGGS